MGHLTRTSGGEFSWGTPQLALSVTPHERPVARAGSGGLSHSVTDLDVAEPCIASRCAVRARNRRLDPTTGSHLFTLGDRRWSPATRAAPPICAAARSFSTAARVTQNQRLCRPSGLCFGMQALINLSRNRVGQSGTWPNMNNHQEADDGEGDADPLEWPPGNENPGQPEEPKGYPAAARTFWLGPAC